MVEKSGYEYYIGLYFWRYNRSTERVEIYTRPEGQDGVVWLDEDRFQGLYEKRWLKNMRYVDASVFFREAEAAPFAVKDATVVRWHKQQGTSHV